ncbi:MCE family protein [Mycobacteroides salmoniphilum]|uniref:MCE family protein n=1 Tax=Mycobacteroides salmoniphilum TaxID=404941 RepID=UPI0010668848|nr:MlaD family protein [Mycobacteroides salmoniphilum]TDZ99336.1 mce related protein [Mycobacteroides salmoniphilum]
MFDRLKRPIEEYNKIWLGTISLVVIAAIVVASGLIGRLALGQTAYRAEFAQAAQIRPGDQVTVAGISVGTVNDLKLAGDRVIVRFNVRNDVHLGSDTRAAIKLTTILGSRYVQLSPAGGSVLASRTIGLANTSVPYDLQKTLADATSTFEQIDADHIAESMTTMSHSLDGVPEALPQALANLKSLSLVVSGRRDQIGTLLSSADSVTTMIRDQKANLGSLVLHGRDLLGEIASRRAAVQRLFANTTTLVNTLKNILNDQPGINEMLASVRDFTRILAEHDALLRNILQALPAPIRNVANVLGSGNSGDAALPAGLLVDSWMCAISGRAKQLNLTEYFKDCQPSPDPFPGWPPPDPAKANPGGPGQ